MIDQIGRLTGKVALVTGAADPRSIGWGSVQALAEDGADIAVNDIPARAAALDQRVTELRAIGRRAIAVPADVTDESAVNAMIDQIVTQLGRLDILGSNAGVIRWERFLDITPRAMHAIIDVNLKGTVSVCQAAARAMIAQGDGGCIVLTSSVQSDIQFPITAVYGATKFAAHTLVECMALELAPHNIRVNHIGPGWVRSALNDPAPDQRTPADIERQRAAVPLQRDGLPYEMGRAVANLASADGAYITGAFLRIDGGLALGKD